MWTKQLKNNALWLVLFLVPTMLFAQGPGFGAFKEGEKCRKARDYECAVSKYDQAIQVEGSNYRYYARKGQILMKMKKIDQAIQAFEGATRVNPGWTSGYLQMAKLSLSQKKYDQAIGYLEKAYNEERDQSAKLRYKLLTVKLMVKQNRPQEAMRELQKAKQIAPKDLRVANYEGEVQMALNNYGAAKSAYTVAVNSAKEAGLSGAKLVKYYVGLAIATGKLEGKDAGMAISKKHVKPFSGKYHKYVAYKIVGGTNAKKNLALAQGYLKAGDYNTAITQIQKAVETKEMQSLVYKMLGMAYFKQGKTAQAINAFQQSAAAEKDDAKKAKLYSIMVKLQVSNQQYSQAVATADKILASQPKARSVLTLKAQSLYQLGQYNACIQAAEAALSTLPDSRSARAKYNFLIGLAAKKAGKANKAKEAFEKAEHGSFKYAAKQEAKSLSAR